MNNLEEENRELNREIMRLKVKEKSLLNIIKLHKNRKRKDLANLSRSQTFRNKKKVFEVINYTNSIVNNYGNKKFKFNIIMIF